MVIGIHPATTTGGMKATGRVLPMQALAGLDLATKDSNFMRGIGMETVAGLNTITAGTRTMTGIKTGTATMTKITTVTSTTTTITRSARYLEALLPPRPSVC